MAKHIRLNERDLKRIIKESVIRFLNENTDEVLDTPERALKAFKAAKADKDAHPGKSKLSPDPAIRAKRKRQMDAFGSKAADLMNQEIDDPNLLVLGDRGARRMYYANGPYSAYINNDVEDLDGLKLYSDTYQEGDEPLTIANLPDDERERIHRGFEKFKGFHNSPDASLEESVKRAVKNAMYNFASKEPQYDINSKEWNDNYTEMARGANDRKRAESEKTTNQQIKHHFGEKGNAEGAEFEHGLDRKRRLGGQRKKDGAMSPETIETEVMRALNGGKHPEEIMNLKPFSPEEIEYIKDDCFDWLDPVGAIDKAGKIVFYDTKKNKFVSYNDEREY